MTITKPLACAAVFALAAGSASAGGYSFVRFDAPPSPTLEGTVGDGINNAGLTTGYYVDGGRYIGFTINADGSGFSSFSRTGYLATGASGIDDAGNIVGVTVLTYGQGTGFLKTPGGTYSDIDPAAGGLPAVYSEAIGINDSGAVVGYFDSVLPPTIAELQLDAHGFIEQGGVYTQFDVPAPLGFGTELFAMNSSGQLTGSFLDNTYGLPHGFIYTPGVGFSFPGGPAPSGVGGINDAGDFLYSPLTYDPTSPIGYGATSYLVKGGVPTAVNVPGATYTEAQGINNHDQVTGLYTDGTGIHAFIASPTPEPATWAMMLIGFGALGATVRARRSRLA